MKEISKMRIGVLRELKNVRILLDRMERKVKSRNPEAVQQGYMFLKTLCIILNDGELSPEIVSLNLDLARLLQEKLDE